MAKTIIDSLFLELGIDTTKFSADQSKALAKISQFEAQAKRSGKGAGDAIKTVGQAFRDLAKDSNVGSSAAHLDSLSKRLKSFGQSVQVAGGVGTPFGVMAEGLGMLLSPAALGIAAVGLLGKGMWDLNKNMTATNATMFRQAQLSDMNATNLWAWGEAAKTVGANPQDVTGGIASVQSTIAGMMIGAGNATPQLVALSRLGLGWDAQSGLNDDQVSKMFERVHSMAAAKGYKNLGGLRALTGPIMNDAMFALATNPNFNPANMQGQVKAMTPAGLGSILAESLKSQEVLGRLGIQKDVLAETAYGGEQGLMQAVVQILTGILDITSRILDFITQPKKWWDGVKSAFGSVTSSVGAGGRMSNSMKMLMGNGVSEADAAAMVGNMMQESSMNPLAQNGPHRGLMQWDASRQAAFAKRFGYTMGTTAISPEDQMRDQLAFAQDELHTTQQSAAAAMARARDLMGKTSAFMNLDERPGDGSLGKRFSYAQAAMHYADLANMAASSARVQHNVSSETTIGDIHVHTPATDPISHADAVRKGIASHPLMSPAAQGTVSLATRGMTG